MSEGDNQGIEADQAFAARVREHSHLTAAADNRLKTAKEALGEVSSQIEEYARAWAEKEGLDVQGKMLISALKTLEPSQAENLFTMFEDYSRNKLNNGGNTSDEAKPSGSDRQ